MRVEKELRLFEEIELDEKYKGSVASMVRNPEADGSVGWFLIEGRRGQRVKLWPSLLKSRFEKISSVMENL